MQIDFLSLLAGILSGIIASMGMGGGAVLLIYLNLFTNISGLKAQGINLIFFIPTAIFSLIIYIKNKEIKWKTILPVALFGLLGAGLGLFLTRFLETSLLTKLFGGFLILIAIKEFFSKDKK